MNLLITRPFPQADKTIKSLNAMGHDCIHEPLLQIEQLTTALPASTKINQFSGIILTSTNALTALNREWSDHKKSKIPVLTTGEATRSAAIEYGFKNSSSVNGSAIELAKHIPQWIEDNQLTNSKDRPALLYPCANEPAHDLRQLLPLNIAELTQWPVYKAVPVKAFTPAIRQSLENNQFDAVLLYSARTALTFSTLWQNLDTDPVFPRVIALSSEICSV